MNDSIQNQINDIGDEACCQYDLPPNSTQRFWNVYPWIPIGDPIHIHPDPQEQRKGLLLEYGGQPVAISIEDENYEFFAPLGEPCLLVPAAIIEKNEPVNYTLLAILERGNPMSHSFSSRLPIHDLIQQNRGRWVVLREVHQLAAEKPENTGHCVDWDWGNKSIFDYLQEETDAEEIG